MTVDSATTQGGSDFLPSSRTDFLPIHGTEASIVLLLIAIVALVCLYAWLLADQSRR